MDGHHQAAFNALVFGQVSSTVSPRRTPLCPAGRPSGGKAAFGLGSCLVAAGASAFVAYSFQFDPTVAKVIIVGATLLLLFAHILQIPLRPRSAAAGQVGIRNNRQPAAKIWRSSSEEAIPNRQLTLPAWTAAIGGRAQHSIPAGVATQARSIAKEVITPPSMCRHGAVAVHGHRGRSALILASRN